MVKKLSCLAMVVCLSFFQILVVNAASEDGHQQKRDFGRYDLLSHATHGVVGFGSQHSWQVKPGFKFGTAYDSNINREAPGKRDEEITLIYEPLVRISRSGTKFRTSGSYDFKFEEFLRDADQSSFNHKAGGNIYYTGKKLSVDVGEKFEWVKTYATSEFAERKTVMIQDLALRSNYQLTPKVGVSALYQNTVFAYKESVLEDRSYLYQDIGGRLFYRIRPRLDLYLQGSGILVDYYRSGIADSKGYSVLAGSTGRLTKKIIWDVQAGFKSQRYDDRAINPFDQWVLRGVLNYRLTPRISTILTAVRDKQESVYRNTNWYEANRLGLTFNYRLTRRIGLSADNSIQKNRYSRETIEGNLQEKRVDYILKTTTSLNWRIMRYIFLNLSYNLRERFSNFDNVFDYVSHALDASIQWQFS